MGVFLIMIGEPQVFFAEGPQTEGLTGSIGSWKTKGYNVVLGS